MTKGKGTERILSAPSFSMLVQVQRRLPALQFVGDGSRVVHLPKGLDDG